MRTEEEEKEEDGGNGNVGVRRWRIRRWRRKEERNSMNHQGGRKRRRGRDEAGLAWIVVIRLWWLGCWL